MKLRFIDKILLYIILATVLIMSLVTLIMAWGLIEPISISNFAYVLFGSVVNKLILTILSILVIIAVCRILFIRRDDKSAEEQQLMHKRGITVDMGDAGSVFVTYSAIESAIIELVCSDEGVADCQCVLVPSNEGISIAVKLVLDTDTPVATVAKGITQLLTLEVEKRLGIKVYGVKITVDTPSVKAVVKPLQV